MASLVSGEPSPEKMVHSWLRLRVPQLTAEMMEFLGKDKGWKTLLKYVVRPETSRGKQVPDGFVEESVKYSYKATMLLAGDGVDHGDSFVPSFRDVDKDFVEMVVDGFSNGFPVCMPHLCLIIRRLLEKKAGGFNIGLLDLLSDDDGVLLKRLFMKGLFPNIHVGCVNNLMVDLMCIPQPVGFVSHTNDPGDFLCRPSNIVKLDRSLASMDILSSFLRLLDDPGAFDPFRASVAVETLKQFLERLSKSPHHDSMVQYIEQNTQGVVNQVLRVFFRAMEKVEAGVDALLEKERATVALEFLNGFARHVFPRNVEGFKNQPYRSFTTNVAPLVDNNLRRICGKLLDSLLPHVTELSKAVFSRAQPRGRPVKHTAYTVCDPFTYYRMQQLTILLAILTESVAVGCSDDVLDSLPTGGFSQMCHWCFYYSHSNMYHHLYLQFLDVILSTNYERFALMVIQPPGHVLESPDAEDFVTLGVDDYLEGKANKSNVGFTLLALGCVYQHRQQHLEAHPKWNELGESGRERVLKFKEQPGS